MRIDFSYDSYRSLLDLVAKPRKCVTFGELSDGVPDGPVLILRHDIDMSLDAALRMAEIEAEMGVRATYFLLFSGAWYNLMGNPGAEAPRRLRQLGHEVGQVTQEQVASVLGAASEDLAAELQKTVDFFVATSAVDRLDRVMLSGGGSLVKNLESILQERFQVNVELLNPFRNIRYNESDFDPDWINSNAPAMAVAVGLAIRTVGD